MPVYAGSLDNVTGIAFAHDLLQITDEEARTRTVASIQRPAVFVPETKRGYELLREMQREKQHMRIVIDEYGGVSGLVRSKICWSRSSATFATSTRRRRHRRAAARARRRLAGSRQLPRRPVADLFGEAARFGRDTTKPRRWAAWSARLKAAFRWPARSFCWNLLDSAWRWSSPRTGASSDCASFRR